MRGQDCREGRPHRDGGREAQGEPAPRPRRSHRDLGGLPVPIIPLFVGAVPAGMGAMGSEACHWLGADGAGDARGALRGGGRSGHGEGGQQEGLEIAPRKLDRHGLGSRPVRRSSVLISARTTHSSPVRASASLV